jgi:hypothetical protein
VFARLCQEEFGIQQMMPSRRSPIAPRDWKQAEHLHRITTFSLFVTSYHDTSVRIHISIARIRSPFREFFFDLIHQTTPTTLLRSTLPLRRSIHSISPNIVLTPVVLRIPFLVRFRRTNTALGIVSSLV